MRRYLKKIALCFGVTLTLAAGSSHAASMFNPKNTYIAGGFGEISNEYLIQMPETEPIEKHY